MAEKKSGGDFVLESRHLVGLFMLLVVIFGVVFTLGYLLGRSQYDSKFRASIVTSANGDVPPPAEPVVKPKPKPASEDAVAPAASPVAPPASDWDFYHSSESKPAEDHLQPAVKVNPGKANPAKINPGKQPPVAAKSLSVLNTAPPSVPAKSAKSGSPANGPLIPKGNIMLQVAAVTSQGDALALAQALQQKKMPAFVIPPSSAAGADKYYRVQVGPYPDNKAATAARDELEAKGFKSIVKR